MYSAAPRESGRSRLAVYSDLTGSLLRPGYESAPTWLARPRAVVLRYAEEQDDELGCEDA